MSAPLLDAVDVEVWMPTPGAAFTLDVNRLGPTTPAQPGLGSPEQVGAWTPMLGDATSVQIRRGGPRNSYTSQAQVGTLHLTIRNRPDIVLSPSLRPGLPVRVSLAGGGARLFTGTVLDIDTAVAREPLTGKQILTTTLSAVDAVQQLANITRYGAKVTGGPGEYPYVGEEWVDRIHRLMKSADGIPYEIDTTGQSFGGQTMLSTNLETSLAAYLDMTVNTVYALWCVRADGTVQFRILPPLTSTLRFTDGATFGSNPLYPYTDIKYDFGTKDLVTAITFNVHSWSTATKDFLTSEVTAADDTLVATYGRRATTIDINCNSLRADLLARKFLSASRAGRANVRSIKVNARTNPAQVAAVELCTRINVRVPAPISQWVTPVVTGIEHDITPGRWITTYHLMRSY